MWHSIVHWFQSLSWLQLGLGAVGAVAAFVVSYVIVSVIVVKMPEDYFCSNHQRRFLPDANPAVRSVAMAVKNILGVLMIVAGILLSLPGIPGPGLVTIFIGLMITDIPGKRVLEANIIRQPLVLSAVNRLRARYNKPAMFD